MCSGFMAFQKVLSQITGLDLIGVSYLVPLGLLFPLVFYLLAREFTDDIKSLWITLLFMLTPLYQIINSSYLFHNAMTTILIVLSLICLVKLMKGTAHPKWVWLFLALVLLMPVPFIYYTGLTYVLALLAGLSLVLLIINIISTRRVTLPLTKPIPAQMFIVAFLFLSLITFLHAVSNLPFRDQLLAYAAFQMPGEPAAVTSVEPVVAPLITMQPWYVGKPMVVSLYFLQYLPLAVLGLLYMFLLGSRLFKGKWQTELTGTTEGRADSFAFAMLFAGIAVLLALSFKGFSFRWADVVPWVAIPMVGIVSRRLSMYRFTYLMIALCLVGAAGTVSYAALSPAQQYARYNQQEAHAYSFVSQYLHNYKMIYTDVKSVGGLVLVGDHLYIGMSRDFASGGTHYIDQKIEVFYSPEDVDFTEMEEYILIADYMYTNGIAPMNEVFPPPKPEARQVLLSHKDIALLYNNGDAQLLAAGNACYIQDAGLEGATE